MRALGTGAGVLLNLTTWFIPQAVIFGTRLFVPPAYRLGRDLLCGVPFVGDVVLAVDDIVQAVSDDD
tara:strand:- start:366 stop:566 length:201 start_codon:yes stop_codon:yes gene_type:complete